MRIYIGGIDGYLGWSLACHLAHHGHTVGGLDDGSRRERVGEVGGQSLLPLSDFCARVRAFEERWPDSRGHLVYGRLHGHTQGFLQEKLRAFAPDAVVHLAEQPSAPWSMIDVEHAWATQEGNVGGTLRLLWAMKQVCPQAHLLKLGTMGEYGTPACRIPEGFLWWPAIAPGGSVPDAYMLQERVLFEGPDAVDRCGNRLYDPEEPCTPPLQRLMFHRSPGSFYHASKVQDTVNVEFACRAWGLAATDIMQGVVYGTRSEGRAPDEPTWHTRWDADECFGTAINRFVACAVAGEPLTLYGAGHQRRGFLPLADSMQCLTIALEQPPAPGEYRVWNQFEQVYDLTALAAAVVRAAHSFDLDPHVIAYLNPRVEAEEHFYAPVCRHLPAHGYRPTQDLDGVLRQMFADLLPHRKRLEAVRGTLVPQVRWDGTHARVPALRPVKV